MRGPDMIRAISRLPSRKRGENLAATSILQQWKKQSKEHPIAPERSQCSCHMFMPFPALFHACANGSGVQDTAYTIACFLVEYMLPDVEQEDDRGPLPVYSETLIKELENGVTNKRVRFSPIRLSFPPHHPPTLVYHQTWY